MTGRKTSAFKQVVNRKGWTLAAVGRRWGVSERQMSRVANSGRQRDTDAANGLPDLLSNGQLPSFLTNDDSNETHAAESAEDAVCSDNEGSEDSLHPLLPKSLDMEGDFIPFVADAAKNTLLELSIKNRITPDELLQRLLASEAERLRLLEFTQENPVAGAETSPEALAIAKLCRAYLSALTHESEIDTIGQVIESLYRELLDKSIIDVVTVRDRIVESKRIKVTKTGYYWYAGAISRHVARWFGCLEIYLFHEMYATNREIIFIGMPANVEVCSNVFVTLTQIFKDAKSSYKRTLHWGTKTEQEEQANLFISDRTEDLYSVQAYIESQGDSYPEEDQYLLYDYQEENYSYTIR